MDLPKYHIDIFWSDEDGGYIANVPDLRYCSAFVESYEEALSEVLVAMELHLDMLRELGRPIPEPGARRGVGVSAFVLESGQVIELEEEEGSDLIRFGFAGAGTGADQGSGQSVEIREGSKLDVSRKDPGVSLARKFFESWVETLEDLEALDDQEESNRRRLQNLKERLKEQQQVLREGSSESEEAAKREAER